MKYRRDLYLNLSFYDDEKAVNHSQKIVRCKEAHLCSSCGREIVENEQALLEKAIFPKEGYRTIYTCIDCCDSRIENTKKQSKLSLFIKKAISKILR